MEIKEHLPTRCKMSPRSLVSQKAFLMQAVCATQISLGKQNGNIFNLLRFMLTLIQTVNNLLEIDAGLFEARSIHRHLAFCLDPEFLVKHFVLKLT